MDHLDAPETGSEPLLPEADAPSAIDQQIMTCCAAFAHTMRCIEGVSAQTARVLEFNGDASHLAALLGSLDRLVTEAGNHSATLGSLGHRRSCAGSA